MLNKTFVIAHNHDTKLKLSRAANLFNFKKVVINHLRCMYV